LLEAKSHVVQNPLNPCLSACFIFEAAELKSMELDTEDQQQELSGEFEFGAYRIGGARNCTLKSNRARLFPKTLHLTNGNFFPQQSIFQKVKCSLCIFRHHTTNT
jgi:hypothetical protein